MKILLFSRSHTPHTREEVCALFDALQEFGFDFALNDEFATAAEPLTGRKFGAAQRYGSKTPAADALVCYGGDGTLLEGIRRLDGAATPVVGINSGHLGFLTSAPKNGFREVFSAIKTGTLKTAPRAMLAAGDLYAVNEVGLQRQGAGMASIEVRIDGEQVCAFHGDGVLVSTPTGSTAWSLSVGGPILSPACACLLITPIGPHNLTMRPLVVPDTSTIQLIARSSEGIVSLSTDSVAIPKGTQAEVTVRKADRRFHLAQPLSGSFYDTLRNKLMWGVDIRS